MGAFVSGTLLGSCAEPSAIPAVNGPLVLEVRYPTTEPIAATDSLSIWGTVGTGKARLTINEQPVEVAPNGGFAAFVPTPKGPRPALELEATRGSTKVRKVIPLTIARAVADPPLVVRPATGWVRLHRPSIDTLDAAQQARPIFSRWTPGGALAVPLPQGLRLPANGAADSAVRLVLATGMLVWVPRAETEPVEPPPNAGRMVHDLRIGGTGKRPTVELEVGEALPVAVEQVGSRIRWTLFGGRVGRNERVRSRDGLVREAAVRPHGDGRVIVEIELGSSPLGWRSRWSEGRATLELRPVPDSGLAGLVVALDPGHPPEGTTGPTGLKEGSMSLAVARKTAAKLKALGMRPVLTRKTAEPVSLEARVAAAEAADAEVLISIHADAPGEGRPPWSGGRTRVFWYAAPSSNLARVMRDSVATAMGQVRGGALEGNLAVLRSPWFPSVLIEATTMTMPEREAYLRSDAGIEAYASGIAAGIRGWVTRFLIPPP